MTDIYDLAIQAVIDHDDIEDSWQEGGCADESNMELHGLLFRTCPHMNCCLTEFRKGYDNPSLPYPNLNEDITPEIKDLFDQLKDDDLIPINDYALVKVWNESDTEARIELLERFAMYNRRLDEVFDREPAGIEGG